MTWSKLFHRRNLDGWAGTIISSILVELNLVPEQIEEKLSVILDDRFFVAGIPDEVLGERLVLVIESAKKDATILNAMKNLKALDKYEQPKEIYFLPKFIETETKKSNVKKHWIWFMDYCLSKNDIKVIQQAPIHHAQ